MNFFKSVFSDDPDPDPSSPSPPETTPSDSPNSGTTPSDFSTPWSFRSTLLQTLATKSESVLQTYRNDLVDFSSSLKLETSTIRQVAARAVSELPARLESGAAVAQSSLESVGQVIDDLTDVIVTRGKDSISILAKNVDSDSEDDVYEGKDGGFVVKPYSRIEAAIRSMQCDLKTYCDEPEDVVEFGEWRGGVVVEDKRGEIEELVEGNAVIREIYDEVVPGRIDHESFWLRYFYRVYKMEKAEEARLRLVKRAIEDEEEDLSWDVEDEDEGEGTSGGFKSMDELKKEIEENVDRVEGLPLGVEEKGVVRERDAAQSVADSRSVEVDEKQGVVRERDETESVADSRSDDAVEEKGRTDEVESSGEKGSKSDEKAGSEGKNDNSDFSVVSSQPSHEEDLGWDDIEDVRSDDENKVVGRTSPNRPDLRERLNVADEDEDLTWDIEDDD